MGNTPIFSTGASTPILGISRCAGLLTAGFCPGTDRVGDDAGDDDLSTTGVDEEDGAEERVAVPHALRVSSKKHK